MNLSQVKRLLLLNNLKKNTINKKKEIERTKKEKDIFLNKIKKKKSLNQKTRKELVAASDKLNKIIDKLLLKLVSGEGLDIFDKKVDLPALGKPITPISANNLSDNHIHRSSPNSPFVNFLGAWLTDDLK